MHNLESQIIYIFYLRIIDYEGINLGIALLFGFNKFEKN